jgi:DNA-binding MarR family transcriptional regulator
MVDANTRELAAQFNQQLRRFVLLVRQATAGQPITAQQANVLASLEAGPRGMSDLAEELAIRLPTLTAQVNRLERDGLATRARDPHDARCVTVRLTATGRRHLQRTRAARIAFLTERLDTLSAMERGSIEAALPALEKLLTVE